MNSLQWSSLSEICVHFHQPNNLKELKKICLATKYKQAERTQELTGCCLYEERLIYKNTRLSLILLMSGVEYFLLSSLNIHVMESNHICLPLKLLEYKRNGQTSIMASHKIALNKTLLQVEMLSGVLFCFCFCIRSLTSFNQYFHVSLSNKSF